MAKSVLRHNEIEGLTREKVFELMTYSPEEMLAQVGTDMPLVAHQRESVENERLMMKQLLANIERNRVKWRADNAEAHVSVPRKMAL